MKEIDKLIASYPTIKIEDGYSQAPSLAQTTANDESVWLRARRTASEGIWFLVDDKVNPQLICPGNIILVDKNKDFTKNMVEIPFLAKERKSLPFDAKYTNEVNDSSTNIPFTRANVNTFINKCLTNYKNGNHDLASNSSWHYERSEHSEGISLGGSIKSVEFSASASRNKTVTVAYMKQIMYTVSLDNVLSEPSDIFTDNVDIAKFKSNIAKGGNGTPAIIDAVNYGRVIMLWAVQEGNQPPSLSIKDFKVSFGNTNSTTKYYLRVYGGVAADDKFNITTDSKEDITNALKEMKEVSKKAMEGASPIEYTLKYLNNMTKNVEWKILPWYKTRVSNIRFRVLEYNKGASMKVYVNALKYKIEGNKYGYYKWESPKKSLDYDFDIPPKSLCIDIKVDVAGDVKDQSDFNIMLPCIPYDSIEQPDSKGNWLFTVRISGTTIYNTKNFTCEPNVPGTFINLTNSFWMNRHSDSPMRKYDKTSKKESEILTYYINWFNSKLKTEKNLRVVSPVKSVSDFRPVR